MYSKTIKEEGTGVDPTYNNTRLLPQLMFGFATLRKLLNEAAYADNFPLNSSQTVFFPYIYIYFTTFFVAVGIFWSEGTAVLLKHKKSRRIPKVGLKFQVIQAVIISTSGLSGRRR